MENKAIKLHDKDNVAVLLNSIRNGEIISIQDVDKKIKLNKGIPYGHKVALKDIGVNEWVIKYGEYMGIATENISKGDHVHVSNVRGLNFEEHAAVLGKHN